MLTNVFDPDNWIHISALARLLNTNSVTLSRRLRRKGAPPILKVGRRVYINRADIDNPVIRLG